MWLNRRMAKDFITCVSHQEEEYSISAGYEGDFLALTVWKSLS